MIVHPGRDRFGLRDFACVDDLEALPEQASNASSMVAPCETRAERQFFRRVRVVPARLEGVADLCDPALPCGAPGAVRIVKGVEKGAGFLAPFESGNPAQAALERRARRRPRPVEEGRASHIRPSNWRAALRSGRELI